MPANTNKLPCSFLWTLEIGDGVKVKRPTNSDPTSPAVLTISNDDNLPIAVAISEDAHLAALSAVGPRQLPGSDFQEWVLRLAPGITVGSVDDKKHTILLRTEEEHSIVVFKMPNPADLAFIVTPNPSDVSKNLLDQTPQTTYPTGT